MVTLKYQKTEAMRFISHIDTLRQINHILRRCKVEVNFSEGFNPHMRLFFSPPLPLGISSVAEYVSIDTKENAEKLLEFFNQNAPSGLMALKAFEVDKDPKLHSRAYCADYVIPFDFEDVKKNKKYFVTKTKQGEEFLEDVTSRVFAIKKENDKTLVRLAVGSSNVRADLFAMHLAKERNKEVDLTTIVKVAQYVLEQDNIQNIDEFLSTKNNTKG